MAFVAIGISLLVAASAIEGRAAPPWLRAAIRAGAGVFLLWLAVAALATGQGCDDTCGNEGPWWEHRDAWQWQAQFWLVIAALAAGGLGLRWPPHRWPLTLVSAALIVMWTVLLLPVDNSPL